MKNPDNDETIGIAGGQLVVKVVPRSNNNCASMSLKGLIGI